MRDMVLYDVERLKKLYKEDLQVSKTGRILFRKTRTFIECKNANFDPSTVLQDGKKGKKLIQITFNFPRYHLLRDPKKNWFEIAMETGDNPALFDLLGDDCPLDITGMILGTLGNRRMWHDVPGEFFMEEEPKSGAINYALFMASSTEQGIFYEDVRALIQTISNSHDVCDPLDNKILVSVNPTEYMVLVPIMLLNGGKAASIKVWDTVFKTKRR